ncbi:hypothetical protein HDV63DRAFT_71516 [Trichoderma sp. SZMC 28014]
MLQLIADQLKDTDMTINHAVAEVLKHFKDKGYRMRILAVEVLNSRTRLSKELLQVMVNQLLDQPSEIQKSGFQILANNRTSALCKNIMQLFESNAEKGVRDNSVLRSILEILASQPALSKRTLRQLNHLERYNRNVVAKFLKHQPALPVEVLEALGEFLTDDIYEGKGQEEAARLLKDQSSLPETALSLVETLLCAKKSVSAGTWSKALEILETHSVFPDERLKLIVKPLGKLSLYLQIRVVEILLCQPYLYTGVLETHLLSF